jgi:signal transduction histidine kinase
LPKSRDSHGNSGFFSIRDEILEANRKLRELDRLKSDFLNTVSYKLPTPLTSIKWSTESLAGLNKNWDEGTFEKLLRIIRVDNQTKLIEQLLSFSRLNAGQLAPKFETFDLGELAEKTTLEMSPTANSKEITSTSTGLSKSKWSLTVNKSDS